MSWTRSASVAGILYGLPYALWVLPLLASASETLPAGTASRVLVLCQCLILLFLAPYWGRIRAISHRVGCVLLAISIPWPVMVPVVAAGAVSTEALLLAESGVLLWALALGLALAAAQRLPDRWRGPGAGAIQGSALVLLVHWATAGAAP